MDPEYPGSSRHPPGVESTTPDSEPIRPSPSTDRNEDGMTTPPSTPDSSYERQNKQETFRKLMDQVIQKTKEKSKGVSSTVADGIIDFISLDLPTEISTPKRQRPDGMETNEESVTPMTDDETINEKEDQFLDETNCPVGPEGLVDIYRLCADVDHKQEQFNQWIDKHRTSQQKVQRLCSYLNQLQKETNQVKQTTQRSQEVVKILQQEVVNQRAMLTSACDVKSEVTRKDGRIQRMVPKCYKQYQAIKDEKEANDLLQLIRNKKNSLIQLESLVQRKRIILKHALPVTLKDSKPPKLPLSRRVKPADNESPKASHELCPPLQPVVIEILTCPADSGSATWTTESYEHPTSSYSPGAGSSSTPSNFITSTESEEISLLTKL